MCLAAAVPREAVPELVDPVWEALPLEEVVGTWNGEWCTLRQDKMVCLFGYRGQRH